MLQKYAAKTKYAKQHLDAGHTASGNPRRCWVVYQRVTPAVGNDTWRIVKVYDEGYRGTPAEIRHIPELPSFVVPYNEYKHLTDASNDWEVEES